MDIKINIDQNHLLDKNNEPLLLKQKDFIREFNKKYKIMASMPDLYEAGKSADFETHKNIQKDLDYTIITSTKIIYNYDSSSELEGTIIHYSGSNIIEPKTHILKIPEYFSIEGQGVSIDQVLRTHQGLTFLQNLFSTTDEPKEIKETLRELTNKKTKYTFVFTPSTYTYNNCNRYDAHECVATLASLSSTDFLFISAGFYIDGKGRSYGKSINTL
ncbi:hypothetical protein JW949_03060 [Candidatus Woesearchaeota archaeon]|nr:hypothetical protein [Candidatus Woesearchaeota archaeon]